jgi:hypothetical protein
MEWSIDMYIRDNPDNLPVEDFNRLEILSEYRDKIFLPDYSQFGYIPRESIVRHLGNNGLINIGLGLASVSANRVLALGYTWASEVNGEDRDGIFSGLIFILNEEYGWDNTIHIDVLAKKRFNVDLDFSLQNTKTYHGNFEEKCIACLTQIKHNYDTYARDIISGEN